MTRIMHIADENYVATATDILEFQRFDMSAFKQNVNYEDMDYTLMLIEDNARNVKSPKLFENIACIIYCVDVSSYDQGRGDQNSLRCCIDEFADLISLKQCSEVPVVIILNKVEIFRRKYNIFPLDMCFRDYRGQDRDSDYALDFIKYKFKCCHSLVGLTKVPFFREAELTEKYVCRATIEEVVKVVIEEEHVEEGNLLETR